MCRYHDASRLRDQKEELRSKDPLRLRTDLNARIENMGVTMAAAELRQAAIDTSKFLPQFNLEGLWRGNYGPHGYETIEIAYEGDKLVATKVTGDANVPAGQITFTCDVSEAGLLETVGVEPKPFPAEKIRGVLEDNVDGALSFEGQGMVAAPGFQRAMYVPGQLLMFPQQGVFGFLWLPLAKMIMFEYVGPKNSLSETRVGIHVEGELGDPKREEH